MTKLIGSMDANVGSDASSEAAKTSQGPSYDQSPPCDSSRVDATRGTLRATNPANLADALDEVPWSLSDVDEAVAQARAAASAWRAKDDAARTKVIRAFQQALRNHAEDMACDLTREIGKPLWESRTEIQAMIGKVEAMLDAGRSCVATQTVASVPGRVVHRPLGVVAVLGPFNFPGHLPNGQIVPALLHGNAVILKPSEKAARFSRWFAKCFAEADLPKGLFHVVQGGVSVAQALALHPDVHGILFTGSVQAARSLHALLAGRFEKRLALELGGKNAAIVLDDFPASTLSQLVFGAFATSGQRCTATSRLIITRKAWKVIEAPLLEAVRRIRIGQPMRDDVFMGPLVSQASVQRLKEARATADALGFARLGFGEAGDRSAVDTNVHDERAVTMPWSDPSIRKPGHFVLPELRLAPDTLVQDALAPERTMSRQPSSASQGREHASIDEEAAENRSQRKGSGHHVRWEETDADTKGYNGYIDEELFGPELTVWVVDDPAQAVVLANRSQFGLVASIFSRSSPTLEAMTAALEVGVVHWNRSTAGASGMLPFGGTKASGNHHPAGILAAQLGTYPQAIAETPLTSSNGWPGLSVEDLLIAGPSHP